jgi:hypothetical protein
MDYKRQSNGRLTFLEHYWFFCIAVSAVLASLILSFFSRLTGTPWIWCYAIALFVAGVGVTPDILFQASTLPSAAVLHFRQRCVAGGQSGFLPLGLSLRHICCRVVAMSVFVETVTAWPR